MSKNSCFASLLVLSIATLVACGQKTGNQGTPAQGNQDDKSFHHISIPDTLTSLEERNTYLAARYWDEFDFSDTAYIHLPDITEQAFTEYLSILSRTGKKVPESSIEAMLTRTIAEDATGTMYPYFLNLYKEYLYDPNSPMRNDELYIPVVEYIIANPVNDFATKEQAKFDLSVMLKNRLGTVATDFGYITSTGIKGRLHQLDKPYTLLFFHNPDCMACEEASQFMRHSSLMNQLVKSGKLDILALYADDDLESWNRHRNQLPSSWIDARDEPHTIRDKALYELTALPTLYLLDSNKKILLKDADIKAIEAYFGPGLDS